MLLVRHVGKVWLGMQHATARDRFSKDRTQTPWQLLAPSMWCYPQRGKRLGAEVLQRQIRQHHSWSGDSRQTSTQHAQAGLLHT